MKREKILKMAKNLIEVRNMPEIKCLDGDLPPHEKYAPVLEYLKQDSGSMLYLMTRLQTLGAIKYDSSTNSYRGVPL